jgi:hypothetical protein
MAPLLLVVLSFSVVLSRLFVVLPLSRMAPLLLAVLSFSVVLSLSQVLVPVQAA